MARLSISWVIPVITLLELLVHTQPTVFDNSNSFISNNHVRYVVDDIATIQSDILSEVHSPTLSSLSMKLKLKFEPEVLDFEQKPLGVPHLAKVVLYNIDKNSSIDMTSISGNTVHFHCSFFEDKQIPPLGNTTFNVVFLGREEGAIESNLFIHTTEGHFRYRVRGASVHSPYRLRPLVSIRLPPNVLFSPIVYMHNPHTEPIQIVEVYSSGGDFNLELPSGDTEGSRDMWQIPPFETRPVIRLRFYSRTEQNQTAYVRIKLNSTSTTTQPLLIIPVELSISNDVLLYHPQGSLDFGVGGSLDPSKHIPLVLMQNPTIANQQQQQGAGAASGSVASRKATAPVRIHGITTVDCPEGVVTVERVTNGQTGWGKGGGGPAGTGVVVANLTLDWKAAFETSTFSGKIKITYKGGKSFTEIPFYLTVVNGGLFYNVSSTKFYVNLKEKFAPKKFTVRNDFQTPLTILNANLSADASIYFTLSDFKRQVLKSKEERPIFVIKLKDNLKHSCHLKGFITVETNISTVQIPLMCYDGKFKAFLPYKSKDNSLDLGLIGFESKKMFTILLVNDNPVAIKIKEIHNSLISTYFELHGCMRRYDEHLLQNTFENAFACENRTVKPKEVAILRLWIDAKKTESRIWGDISVVTQFEELSIPVHFQIAPGKLDIGPDRLVFDQCFPGKLCSHPLRVHSTFSEGMLIDDILPIPPDVRIYAKHSGRIPPKAATIIGNLYLDPKAACQDECYLGLSNSELETWLSTLALPNQTSPTNPSTPLQFDIDRVNTLHARFRAIPTSWTNLTLRLDTTRVRGHVFHTRMRMDWPRLLQHVTAASIGWPFPTVADVTGITGLGTGGGGEGDLIVEKGSSEKGNDTGTVITLPRTQIDSVRFVNLTICNPSSGPLLVQAVLSGDYTGWEELYEGLPPSFLPTLTSSPPTSPATPFPFFFQFPPNGLMTRQAAFRRHIGQPLLAIHPNTLPLVLAPKENYTITVGYRALDAVESTGMLLIRSNLTVLEVVVIKASGAVVNFKFGNRKPGSIQPLQFELTEKHLKDCEPNQKRYAPPNLTVKRSFTARNNGEFDISIASFFINDFECEGHGFKVLNCEPFVLPPNATKKINIAFTPDFTLAKITRTLILITSLHTPVNYTLITTVPYNYLSLCASIITRPPFEIYLYYLIVATLTLSLVIVIILAILDSDRVLKNALATMTKQCNPQQQHTLDLRLVGAQIRTEFKTSKDGSCSSGSGSEGSSSSNGSPERQRVVNLEQPTCPVVATGESICKKSPVVSNRHESDQGGGAGVLLNEPKKVVSPKETSKEVEKPVVIPVIGKAKKKLAKKIEPVESTNTIETQPKPKASSHPSNHSASPSTTNDAATSTATNAKHKANAKQSSLLHFEQNAQIQHNHDVSTITTIQNATISVQTSPISHTDKDLTTFTFHHNKKSTHKESSMKDKHNHKHEKSAHVVKKQQQQQFLLKQNAPSNVMCPSSSNEEDASSQTESNSSREEEKAVGKKQVTTPEVYYEKTKVERRKSTPKSMKIKEHKNDKENHDKHENGTFNNKHHPKPTKHNSSSKSHRGDNPHRRTSGEKQTLAKKFSLDKNTKLNDTSNNSHSGNVRGSPSFNRWDENRASFSDVVARNEVSVVTSTAQSHKTSVPAAQNKTRSTSASSQQHTTTNKSKPSPSTSSTTSPVPKLLTPPSIKLNTPTNAVSNNTTVSPITNKLNQQHQQPKGVNHPNPPKPILCVEPKQTMPSLGPIGSKKTGVSSSTAASESNQWSSTDKTYSINQLNSTLESMLDATACGQGSGKIGGGLGGTAGAQLLNEGTSVLNHVTSQAPGFLADALTSYHTSSFLDLGFDSALTSTQNWIHQQHCGGQRLDMFGGMVGRCDETDPWNSSTSPTPSSSATNTSNTSARNSTSPSNSNHAISPNSLPPQQTPNSNHIQQQATANPPINVPISTTGCSYWDQMNPNSLYTNNPPVVLPSHLMGAQQQQQQQKPLEVATPMMGQQSGYLWGGGNSVWQPWTPPRTPTRTPPGFTPRDEDEEEIRFQQTMQPPQTQLYNPFGNNIWNQQQNNPWNYPQGQQ